MTRANAMSMRFEEITIMGRKAIFSPDRIDRTTVPAGLFQYEIRHADENWGEPCQIAKGILVNFYGTVITSDPIQLGADGKLDFEPSQFKIEALSNGSTITQYQASHPASGIDCMELTVAQRSEDDLFFSQSEEHDRKNGCIGHLRGDFGDGKQFYSTWWPHQDDRLNKAEFKADLPRVVNWLRKDFSPLKDLDSMRRFCNLYGSKSQIPDAMLPSHGFRIDTQRFLYMLRCYPHMGDYNFYLYCYDKEEKEHRTTATKQESGACADWPATRTFAVTISCSCVYNGTIQVPAHFDRDAALKYAREHLSEIPLSSLTYIPDSDQLDEENCDFEPATSPDAPRNAEMGEK